MVYVIAIRNPISVAQSLARRNQFPEAKTYLLWLAHMLPALTMTRDSERVLVDYDKLLDSPVEELTRISAKLALPLNPKSVAEFEQEFLDNELRHTRYASQDLNLIRSAPRQVKELFAAAESACRDDDRSTPALDVSIASAQRYLDDIAPLLRFEWQVDLQVQQFHRTHAESGAQIRRLDDALTERSGQLGDAERALADRNRKIEELDSALVNRNQQLEGLENALAERSRQLESLNNALEDRNRRIRELENALHDLNATHAQLEHLSGEHRSQQEIIHSLEQTLAAQGTELSRCAEIIKQTRESTSWRVTAPLRALRKSLSARKA
ncbi:hypothetical protein P0D71_13910 [Paraburkholderia sp. RL17-383-BIF-A]|uniref:hypothetical protein n=1 Tax=Paraburkholderia sp. RL17-383-BIF-A TaxID=3031631 RepID=UPI0038B933F5